MRLVIYTAVRADTSYGQASNAKHTSKTKKQFMLVIVVQCRNKYGVVITLARESIEIIILSHAKENNECQSS